jgi:Ca2+-binding RTX toxin-like protein
LTLNYQTQNGTATSGGDYVAATGQVTFAVGQQVATVTVPVSNDLSLESSETLSLVLTGARLRNGPETLVGTIDTVVVQDGAISSGLDSNFSGIKKVTYLSDGDGEDQVLVIDNDNVPASGSVLTINAGSSTETETFTFNGSSVTAYSVNVTTGAANDVINTYNGRADVISSGSGNDRISAAGGDTINAGAGADTIVLEEGNNTVFAGDGDDVIDFEDDDNIDFNSRGSNNLYGEGGDDTFFVSLSEDLTANDVIDGGVGTDTIDVIGNVVDAQFTNATNVEVLLGGNGGSVNFTLAVQAQEAGIRTINLTQGGIDVVDASAFTVGLTVSSSGGDDVITTGTGADIVTAGVGSSTINTGGGDDLIAGGLNGDILTGGAGADTFRYQTVNDSRISSGVNNRDVITDFTSGEDKIDLLTLADSTAVGQTVRFAGNFNTLAEGQAAISGTGADADLNVVYVRGDNTLWVDVDNNAVLNDNDLQIILQGVTNLVAADVNSPQLVTGPVGSGSFGSMGDQGQTLGPRFDSLFHSEQFA